MKLFHIRGYMTDPERGKQYWGEFYVFAEHAGAAVGLVSEHPTQYYGRPDVPPKRAWEIIEFDTDKEGILLTAVKEA